MARVPSLYVRVYHVLPSLLLSSRRSLTIREGISGRDKRLRRP